MEARIGHLADGVQARQVGTGHLVGDHATTGVVGGGYHRDGLAGDVDPQFQAPGMDGGKVLDDEVRGPMGDVQIEALGTQALHLVVDGAGDDVARGQLGALVKAVHKTLAVWQQEAPALATQGLGDEESPGLGVIEAGRMELHELHVAHPATGAPGHGDAIAGGDIGVAGVEIDLAGAARGDDHETGQQGLDLAAGIVEDIGAETAVHLDIQFAPADEVHGDVALQDLDVGAGADLTLEGGLHLLARGVGGVDDAAMGMTALAGEVVAAGLDRLVVTGKFDALIEEPANAGRAVIHHQLDPFRIAEVGAGIQGILDMGSQGVVGVEDGGYTALGIEGAALAQIPLGDQGDGEGGGQAQG